jgi:hypothetical protein
VYLRALPGMDVPPARWEKTFAGVPSEQWTIFADPAPLPDLDALPL